MLDRNKTIVGSFLNSTQSAILKNFTNISYVEPPFSVSEWLLVVAFTVIMLTGVTGNLLVCFVFGYKRKRTSRTKTEWLILYLGIIDLFASICNPPLFIFWTITRYNTWPFGALACKILPALGPITTSSSAGILLIIAIDRYTAIVTPFIGQLSWKVVTSACIVNVTLSVLSNVHYIYFIQLKDSTCSIQHMNSFEYGIPNCLFIILRLSLFLVIFIYTNICIFRAIIDRKTGGMLNEQLDKKRNNRIMIVLLIMGIVFAMLVFPREIFFLVYNLSWLNSNSGLKYTIELLTINSWLKVLHTANSCANVFIYSQMQTYFRKHVLRLLYHFGCCKNKRFQSESQKKKNVRKNACVLVPFVTDRGAVIITQSKFFKRAHVWKKSTFIKHLENTGVSLDGS